MKSLAIGFYRSWACHQDDEDDDDDDEKWIASICPIETILTLCSEFLLIRRPSFSILLSSSLSIFCPWSFSSRLSHLFANLGTSSNKFAATIFHSECGGARIGGLPSSWLSCARPRSHAVSTRVNFNSLSDDPRSDLLNIRRPLLVRCWICSESP